MKRVRIIVALVLASLCFGVRSASARDCRIDDFRVLITSEGPWPAQMFVRAGTSCGSRRWRFTTYTPKQLYLARNASHGKVTLSAPGGYRYTPAPGYLGADAFDLKLCGVTMDNISGCAIIAFKVEVQDNVP
jgi:hypothetical protein